MNEISEEMKEQPRWYRPGLDLFLTDKEYHEALVEFCRHTPESARQRVAEAAKERGA